MALADSSLWIWFIIVKKNKSATLPNLVSSATGLQLSFPVILILNFLLIPNGYKSNQSINKATFKESLRPKYRYFPSNNSSRPSSIFRISCLLRLSPSLTRLDSCFRTSTTLSIIEFRVSAAFLSHC